LVTELVAQKDPRPTMVRKKNNAEENGTCVPCYADEGSLLSSIGKFKTRAELCSVSKNLNIKSYHPMSLHDS
jgi:hypothetical protein